MRTAATAITLALALALAGCGGSSDDGESRNAGTGGSGGTTGGGGGRGGTGGGDGPCTDLTLDDVAPAEWVVVHGSRPGYVDAPPQDGTYLLTELRAWVEWGPYDIPEGPTGETTKAMLRIAGDRVEWLTMENGREERVSGTWEIAEMGGFGAQIDCPRPPHYRMRGLITRENEVWLQTQYCVEDRCLWGYEIFTRQD